MHVDIQIAQQSFQVLRTSDAEITIRHDVHPAFDTTATIRPNPAGKGWFVDSFTDTTHHSTLEDAYGMAVAVIFTAITRQDGQTFSASPRASPQEQIDAFFQRLQRDRTPQP